MANVFWQRQCCSISKRQIICCHLQSSHRAGMLAAKTA